MSVTVTTREFAPFGKCVVISNGCAEAVVTVDLGPRIIGFSALGGESFLFADTELRVVSDDPSIKEKYGKDLYHFYGGHRLWWTPERLPETYAPDDDPVAWNATETGAVFTPDVHPTGIQYSIEIKMAETGSHVDIIHTLTNVTGADCALAPWSITQCRGGGIAVAPQNTRQCAPLPNRTIVHWPYNDMRDERFVPAPRYITLRHVGEGVGAFKFGMNNETGWAGYLLDGQLLRKGFAFDPNAVYEDYGCNFESYTDKNALEIEALGALVTLADGESTVLNECWDVIPYEGELPAVDSDEFADLMDKLNASI